MLKAREFSHFLTFLPHKWDNFFPPKKKLQKFIFSKYHNFVKNDCTTIKFIPDVLLEQKKRFVQVIWQLIDICWFLMIFAKKFDLGQKIGCNAKKVANFSTSKCAKNDAFQNFSKQNFLRTPFCIKKPYLKRIWRNFESHRFSDHFCKPLETPGKCCFGK